MKKALASKGVTNVKDATAFAKALEWAADNNEAEVLLNLLRLNEIKNTQKAANGSNRALRVAVDKGHVDCAKALWTYGASLYTSDEKRDGRSREALLSGTLLSELCDACSYRDFSAIESTLAAGASFNSQNSNGMTPLDIAISRNTCEVTKLLLSHGANVNKLNQSGRKPLEEAVYHDYFDLVEMLIAHGAPVNVLGEIKSPLWLAVDLGHTRIVNLLLEHGANVDARYRTETPLMHAAYRGRPNITGVLLSHGATQSLENKHGQKAVDMANANNHQVRNPECRYRTSAILTFETRMLRVSFYQMRSFMDLLMTQWLSVAATLPKAGTPLRALRLHGIFGHRERQGR